MIDKKVSSLARIYF